MAKDRSPENDGVKTADLVTAQTTQAQTVVYPCCLTAYGDSRGGTDLLTLTAGGAPDLHYPWSHRELAQQSPG